MEEERISLKKKLPSGFHQYEVTEGRGGEG